MVQLRKLVGRRVRLVLGKLVANAPNGKPNEARHSFDSSQKTYSFIGTVVNNLRQNNRERRGAGPIYGFATQEITLKITSNNVCREKDEDENIRYVISRNRVVGGNDRRDGATTLLGDLEDFSEEQRDIIDQLKRLYDSGVGGVYRPGKGPGCSSRGAGGRSLRSPRR